MLCSPFPSPFSSLLLSLTFSNSPLLVPSRCVESRDYSGALSSLHRYFDYCMMNGSNLNNNNAGNDTNTQQLLSQQPLNLLPYSILTLAKLHYYFGHTEQAIQVSCVM